ncbi:MAG: LemA family protein [Nitrosomonadales bacterium]|nr:LemA family protein [Nitrosomonadales bacterium]
MFILIFLGVITVLLIYGITLYNHLVNVKHAVAKAWANIDVLLKQRHDELPKLVEVCRQYKEFEQATLQKVIEARSRVQAARQQQDIPALGQAEGMLRMGLGNIFAVAEAYPELKANENFMQLQTRITSLENGIADRRELYNETVNINNVQIEVFPASIIAALFNFGAKPLLEFSASEKADVDMKQLFS